MGMTTHGKYNYIQNYLNISGSEECRQCKTTISETNFFIWRDK